MIYPPDTIYFGTEISGNVSQIIETADSANPLTILSIRIQQEKENSTTNIDCGSIVLARNWGKDYPIAFPFTICTDDVVLVKTGSDTAFVSVVYAPYNINEATGSVVPTSQPFTLNHSFTFGEITIALLLIPLLIVVFYQTILQAFRKPIIFHK